MGSFECSCRKGYKLLINERSCQGKWGGHIEGGCFEVQGDFSGVGAILRGRGLIGGRAKSGCMGAVSGVWRTCVGVQEATSGG